jgi:hypothetical protein
MDCRAVQIGNIVHIGYAEIVSLLTGRIIGPLTPHGGVLWVQRELCLQLLKEGART